MTIRVAVSRPAHRRGKRWRWLIAAGLAAAVASLGTARALRDEAAGKSPKIGGALAHRRAAGGGVRPAEPPAAPPASVPELHDERELDDYLRDIESRAERDPEVAVMEVENGVEAIHRLVDRLGAERAEQMQRAFTDRLDRVAIRENEDAQPDEVDSLIASYEQTSEVRERDRLRRRYMAAVGKLGLIDRVRELGRIQRFAE